MKKKYRIVVKYRKNDNTLRFCQEVFDSINDAEMAIQKNMDTYGYTEGEEHEFIIVPVYRQE